MCGISVYSLQYSCFLALFPKFLCSSLNVTPWKFQARHPMIPQGDLILMRTHLLSCYFLFHSYGDKYWKPSAVFSGTVLSVLSIDYWDCLLQKRWIAFSSERSGGWKIRLHVTHFYQCSNINLEKTDLTQYRGIKCTVTNVLPWNLHSVVSKAGQLNQLEQRAVASWT